MVSLDSSNDSTSLIKGKRKQEMTLAGASYGKCTTVKSLAISDFAFKGFVIDGAC